MKRVKTFLFELFRFTHLIEICNTCRLGTGAVVFPYMRFYCKAKATKVRTLANNKFKHVHNKHNNNFIQNKLNRKKINVIFKWEEGNIPNLKFIYNNK